MWVEWAEGLAVEFLGWINVCLDHVIGKSFVNLVSVSSRPNGDLYAYWGRELSV